MRNCRGLPCGSGGSGRRRSAHLTCRGTTGEPPADLFCEVQLATAEGPGPRDGIAWAAIALCVRLEQSEHSLGAVSRPHSNDSSLGFA